MTDEYDYDYRGVWANPEGTWRGVCTAFKVITGLYGKPELIMKISSESMPPVHSRLRSITPVLPRGGMVLFVSEQDVSVDPNTMTVIKIRVRFR